MQRRLAKAWRNMPDEATVSALALIGRRASLRDLVEAGMKPQVRASRWRSPVPGWRRTTGASMVGAMFQVGFRFGSGFRVLNRRAIDPGGRKLA